MGKMKKYVAMFCAMLALGVAGTSCSSDEEVAQGEAGEGVIAFDITTDTKFQSRAVSLSAYENLIIIQFSFWMEKGKCIKNISMTNFLCL